MSIAYILPSNRPKALECQMKNLQTMLRDNRDCICVSNAKGMNNAFRQAFAQGYGEIVRNCADDDDYNLPGSIKAVEIMEADSSIDVMVTGGVKTRKIVCVPKGENYGASIESVAWYGACGSGLFMRRDAVEKHGLLDYDGRLIDVFAVLKAIASGAKVRFCRLDTYRHHMSLLDMTADEYAVFRVEKQQLHERFGIWGTKRRAHEIPPVWDGAFA